MLPSPAAGGDPGAREQPAAAARRGARERSATPKRWSASWRRTRRFCATDCCAGLGRHHAVADRVAARAPTN